MRQSKSINNRRRKNSCLSNTDKRPRGKTSSSNSTPNSRRPPINLRCVYAIMRGIFVFSVLIVLTLGFLTQGVHALSLSIVSPENTTYNTSNFTVVVNVSGGGNETLSCFLSLDSGENNSSMTNTSLSVFEYNLSSLNETYYVADVFCNSTQESTSHERVGFTVDTVPPDVQITSLSSNDSYKLLFDVPLNYTSDDEYALCVYSLNGDENVSLAENITIPAETAGVNIVEITCTDAVGNTGYANATFNVFYPEGVFQRSYRITTGEPFYLGHKITLNETDGSDGKNVTVELWGIYDTDNDGEIDDEYTILNVTPGSDGDFSGTIAINAINNSSYPLRLNFEVPEFNGTELAVLVVWNTTIEPVNFDLNARDEVPECTVNGSWWFSSDRNYLFVLPTNFSMNYTHVRAVWPYVSDGEILDVLSGMPSFEITGRGIEATFDKVIGTSGY